MSDLGHNLSYNPSDLDEAHSDLFVRLEEMIREADPEQVAPRLITMALFGMFTLSKFVGADVARDLLGPYWRGLPPADPKYAVVEVRTGSEKH